MTGPDIEHVSDASSPTDEAAPHATRQDPGEVRFIGYTVFGVVNVIQCLVLVKFVVAMMVIAFLLRGGKDRPINVVENMCWGLIKQT